MRDLFWRLAQRARLDADPGLTAETEPEFGRLDEELAEAEAVAAGPAAAPAPALIEQPPAVTADRADEKHEPRPSVDREIRLVPMPVVVPPSEQQPLQVAPAAANAEPGAPKLPAIRGLDPLPAVPTRSEGASRRSGTLDPVPLPPQPGPAIDAAVPSGSATGRAALEVTIGRIEIRVRPPAPVRTGSERRPAEPVPALTLEEYLRRREAPS